MLGGPCGRKGNIMTILERIKCRIDPLLQITQGSTPIVFFGDYENARSCTISLNPSDREFCDKHGNILFNEKERLCSRKKLSRLDDEELSDKEAYTVLEYCKNYFKIRPYKNWFDKYEAFLEIFNLSYYSGSVVHLDLVQWATTPFWSNLNDNTKIKLLNADLPFLKELLNKDFEYIFLNGKTVVHEVSKHLNIKLHEIIVSGINNYNLKIYFGYYNRSRIIGWSIYLQSAAVGSYSNVKKIASIIYEENTEHLTTAST